MKTFVKFFFLLMPFAAFSQVDQIKSSSSSHSSSSGGSNRSDGSGGSSFVGNFFFNFAVMQLIQAQQQKLQQRSDMPYIVSIDMIAQAAAQPSSYYIINPRIRGNWGLFSTDFRMNYLIEESADGIKHLRTNDWQIVEMNIVTTPDFLLRIGGGTMIEAFGGRNTFLEWTAGGQYQPRASKWGAVAEYRGAEVRKEVSGFAQYEVFDHRALHGYLTMGATYQRFYQTISTWGLQGGFVCKLY
jgi:hypothetical protein